MFYLALIIVILVVGVSLGSVARELRKDKLLRIFTVGIITIAVIFASFCWAINYLMNYYK